MANGWQALHRGESISERRSQLERAHARFVSSADVAADVAEDVEARLRFARDAGMRSVVLDSWLRSRDRTIDPDLVPDRPVLGQDELAELRRTHPVGRLLPLVQRLLSDEAAEAGFIVAVGDASGRLLWIDGDRRLRSRAEEMGFRSGMDWSESAVGTSAPGSAIALDHSIQVLGAEHYSRAVHQWSCTAAPVHDPLSGSILGVIDVTGGDEAASPHILPLVEATLAAVEAELKLISLREMIEREQPKRVSRRPRAPQVPRIVVLGRDPAILESASGSAALAGRHAEILLALAAAPHGLSAAVLAEQVYGDRAHEPRLRPELVRLRRWLEEHRVDFDLESRPYRLSTGLRVDAVETLDALDRGAHRLALAAYDGPVLPASASPVVEELRSEVDATLREAMLQSAAPEVLYDYAERWGAEDLEIWRTLLRVLPPLSPKRARVVARLEAR
ncbi:transcriptional regulator [Leucobacter soli]|uniref:GAF domain-containing protein n=1 Tax=Leucobacter soli TaxID=2812850 RepID=A0A916NFH5_9MICO|nr:transcriptional regulator [Leucobacter soli]CAG7598755.1 hypothetical protein LEUCIP111803_00254 [Leucobacter soli]